MEEGGPSRFKTAEPANTLMAQANFLFSQLTWPLRRQLAPRAFPPQPARSLPESRHMLETRAALARLRVMAPPKASLTKDQVAERLAAHAEELRSLGVRSLDLFGSTVRGNARPDSDVDLLVEFDEVPGLVGYVRIQHRLQDILGRRVDLVMASGLKPRIRERVLSEARRVA